MDPLGLKLADLNTQEEINFGGGTYSSSNGLADIMVPGNVTVTESWNGSAWTETTDLNTARVTRCWSWRTKLLT